MLHDQRHLTGLADESGLLLERARAEGFSLAGHGGLPTGVTMQVL
jgi:hypothetical protein